MLKQMLTLGLGAALTAAAVAQPCTPEWSRKFFAGGVAGGAAAMVVFDDGRGPAIYAAGEGFTPGGSPSAPEGLARWDGHVWTPVGDASAESIGDMAVYNDGTGPALYVAGRIRLRGATVTTSLARWNGSTWSALGEDLDGAVFTLTVYDDGSGARLCAGGGFEDAGGVPAWHVAAWNGQNWAPIGAGVGTGVYDYVRCLEVCDDGSGPTLFASGRLTENGDTPPNTVYKWNGTDWANIVGPLEMFGTVLAMTSFDDGDGPVVYMGGWFNHIAGIPVEGLATWNGASWSAVPDVGLDHVYSMLVRQTSQGEELCVAGTDTWLPEVRGIRRWDGRTWSSFADELDPASVGQLVEYDDGSGTRLYADGSFPVDGVSSARAVRRWTGATWEPITPHWDPTVGQALNGSAEVLTTLDPDGVGPQEPLLYATGYFGQAAGVAVESLAYWDGRAWHAVPDSGYAIKTMAAFDAGNGPELYVGGAGLIAKGIARWTGSEWLPLGEGLGGLWGKYFEVQTTAVFDDGRGPALYVGGEFSSAGSTAANGLARWDGSAWEAIDTGTDPMRVFTLMPYDDGEQVVLVCAGTFDSVAGVPAHNIAAWNGMSWSSLGAGTDGSIYAMAVGNEPQGPALYVAGSFENAGNSAARSIARWDGQSWSAVGAGTNQYGYPLSLAFFDDGSGTVLYAAGYFDTMDGVPARGIAKWDGTQWSAVGGSIDNTIDYAVSLATFDDDGDGPTPPALYMGGWFTRVGGVASRGIARWGCRSAQRGDLNCDGTTNLADVNPFVLALIDPVAYDAQNPDCDRRYADCNDDGVVNFADINAFIAQLDL